MGTKGMRRTKRRSGCTTGDARRDRRSNAVEMRCVKSNTYDPMVAYREIGVTGGVGAAERVPSI